MKTLKIPTLMYHEVSRLEHDRRTPSHLTPLYNVSEDLFEQHMHLLAEHGYTSLFFDEIHDLNPAGRYIIITFDDGLAGNRTFALPILKKYGFKAIFFVTIGFISKPHYMNWQDLADLVAGGMSVQSHTMTHPHLPILSEVDIRTELLGSKTSLESRLHTTIDALSFPHGSYNRHVVRIAKELGYRTLCTSEVRCNNTASFVNEPAVIGRLTMTSRVGTEKLLRLVEYNTKEIYREKLTKTLKNTLKKTIGIHSYGKLYRAFFNIKSSS